MRSLFTKITLICCLLLGGTATIGAFAQVSTNPKNITVTVGTQPNNTCGRNTLQVTFPTGFTVGGSAVRSVYVSMQANGQQLGFSLGQTTNPSVFSTIITFAGGTPEGIQTLTVNYYDATNANYGWITEQVTFLAKQVPTISPMVSKTEVCPGQEPVSLTLNTSNGNGNYRYVFYESSPGNEWGASGPSTSPYYFPGPEITIPADKLTKPNSNTALSWNKAYVYIVTDVLTGCSTSGSVYLKLKPANTVLPSIVAPATACAGTPVALSATTASGTIIWQNGTEGNTLTVAAVAPGSNTFTAFNRSAGGCNGPVATAMVAGVNCGLQLVTPTYTCSTGAITFNTTGGDGTPITFKAIGVQRESETSASGVVEAGLRADPKPLTIEATQSGTTVSLVFDFAASCSGTTPPDPSTGTSGTTITTSCGSPANTIGQPLTLLAPDFDCATRTLSFKTSGGDGSPITFFGIGITSPTTSCSVVIDQGNADATRFTLQAMQNGTTVSYEWVRPCVAGRVAAIEKVAPLTITVLGNPTLAETVEVIVAGAAGSPLRLNVRDSEGRLVNEQLIEQATATERHTLRLGHSAGMYFIQAATPAQRQSIKVIRQ